MPKIPAPVMSHHLTMLTLVWSAAIVLFGWLATSDLRWLHAVSVMVVLQWFTDSFDGSLGRYRRQGLVKWGFFSTPCEMRRRGSPSPTSTPAGTV